MAVENVGSIEVDAKLNTSDYTKGKKKIESDNSDIEKSTNQMESGSSSAFQKLGSAAVNAGKVMAAGLAVGATAIAGLTLKSLLSGAELEQQLGGSEAVFEKYALDIQNVALNAYDKMGLSQNEFLAGANKMGSLYQGAGLDVKKSMELSAESIQRASDVASIMGIDTSFALESVTAMAKGNFTMMDNLGVAMNDTALNAYALEKGLGKTTQQMSMAEKVGLATELFLEKTAKYAGNYAKENETLAGSLNTTKKAFQDFISGGNTVDNFIQSAIQTLKIAVPQIMQTVPYLVDAIGQLIREVGPMIAESMKELVPSLINAAIGLFRTLVDSMPVIIRVLLDALPIMIKGFQDLFLGFLQALPEVITMIAKAIPDIIQAITGVLTNQESLRNMIEAYIKIMLALVEALPLIITAIADALPLIINSLVTFFTDPANIRMLMAAGVQLFMGLVKAVPQILMALVSAFTSIIANLWNSLGAMFTHFAGDFGKGIGTAFKNAINGVLKYINGLVNNPIELLNKALEQINKIPGVNIGKLSTVAIPQLAEGAVVDNRPGGILANIGEGNEPEAVIPLSKLDKMLSEEKGKGGKGGVVVNQNNVINSPLDMELVNSSLTWQLGRI